MNTSRNIFATVVTSHLACLIGALFADASHAQTSVTIYSSAQPGSLSAINFQNGGEGGGVPGYAVVRQEREATLTKGRSLVRISDVPSLIDPTTVSFESLTDPANTRVVEQSFEFDLTSTNKLLQKYLDRDVTVEQTRGTTVEAFTGRLISAQGGGLVLRMADGSIRTIANFAGVKLASLPGGLISKPTLVWDVAAQREGNHRTRYGYQTNGITWWTDYNLTLNEDQGACKVDVGAWVTIVNQSGATFEEAKLKLVAGDVQRAKSKAAANGLLERNMVAAAPVANGGFAEKSFFEYHLYTLGRPATLTNNSTKQIELFPVARGASCEKTLVYDGQGPSYGDFGGPMLDRNFGNQSNKKVDVYLRFKNREDNNLGIPLPAGKIRVAKIDSADQSLEFIGEDLIDHTPKNETVQIKLGSAFDVVGERRQVDFRVDSTAKWMEEDIEVKLRSQKTESVTVIVKENLFRWTNWVIKKQSQAFDKADARTIHFPVKIGKEGSAIVRYTVRYTW